MLDTTRPPRTLKTAEAAAFLKIHKTTLYALVARGELRKARPGRSLVFLEDDLVSYLRGGQPCLSTSKPAVPAHMQPMALFAVETGLRQANVLGLTWDRVKATRLCRYASTHAGPGVAMTGNYAAWNEDEQRTPR